MGVSLYHGHSMVFHHVDDANGGASGLPVDAMDEDGSLLSSKRIKKSVGLAKMIHNKTMWHV